MVTGTALEAENRNRGNEDVDFFGIFMRIFAAVALLVGAFIINNTFAILVAQRTKELALLRAIGASTKQVRRSVAIEAAVVGVVASLLGLLAGVGVAKGIGALWASFGVTMPEGPLVVRPASLLIAFALGVAVTVGSALLPARRAARVAPVEAMRSVAAESARTSKRRIALGVALVAGSVAPCSAASPAARCRWSCWARSPASSASRPSARCWPGRWCASSDSCCPGSPAPAGSWPGRMPCATPGVPLPPPPR